MPRSVCVTSTPPQLYRRKWYSKNPKSRETSVLPSSPAYHIPSEELQEEVLDSSVGFLPFPLSYTLAPVVNRQRSCFVAGILGCQADSHMHPELAQHRMFARPALPEHAPGSVAVALALARTLLVTQ